MEKFSLGQLVVTKGIQSKINSDVDFLINVLEILERYRRCDWGDLCEDDKAQNENALIDGGVFLPSTTSVKRKSTLSQNTTGR